jgi:hypothetical protein
MFSGEENSSRASAIRCRTEMLSRAGKISLGSSREACYVLAAFVALVTPLDSIEGAASSLAASFALRLEAVEKHK